ncbi:conjugal transfer protein TraB [Thermococcus sp. GR7]|uniref:TraB domain-containing protein n=1 Tax=unclassified Thermococcus TaxID=2627626 RepID=UPI00142F3DD8|nr:MULTISPECIES: TraB/GumN family protein [unclassified Thermococcus]NJE46230.1 conjugal transfer protein TraB [Thermococcus sp. GR7]NJE79485.1 conjugal transfer protein TraB [Thermococcus sp. GR4]NJF23890.1 conjugal transfer protein TraB [Thermococcus sp. GR5]
MSYLRYVKLIGTMHVSPKSREEVISTILSEKPHAVAIELDRARFLAMKQNRELTLEESLRYGKKGLINYVLAKVEERLGEEFGMKPGEEMKAAISAAQTLGVPLYLIDEDINVILAKIAATPSREKLLMALEALSVFLPVGVSGSSPDVMADYKVMMIQFRLRYPYLYRVLVEERNEVMARNLISIVNFLKAQGVKKPKVVAVVGLGHKPGIEHLLNSAKEKAFISSSWSYYQ